MVFSKLKGVIEIGPVTASLRLQGLLDLVLSPEGRLLLPPPGESLASGPRGLFLLLSILLVITFIFLAIIYEVCLVLVLALVLALFVLLVRKAIRRLILGSYAIADVLVLTLLVVHVSLQVWGRAIRPDVLNLLSRGA